MARLFLLMILYYCFQLPSDSPLPLYPASGERVASPGRTAYYIDPVKGDDSNTGTERQHPWKTFRRVNQLLLAAGDTISILAPGDFHESLALMARGTAQQPVQVVFAPGRYHFFPDKAIHKQLHISNTNDRPYAPKAIAIMLDSCAFVQMNAAGADLVLRGKMIEAYVNSCSNIRFNGFSFDYQRPTVSELTITGTGNNYADAVIHPDSKFSIADSLLSWTGEGWSYRPGNYWQVLDPATNELSRTDISMEAVRFAPPDGNKVRMYFSKNPGFKKGCIYQNRDVTRDCAGIFMQYSRHLSLQNIRVHFMHGMGIVSQYCQGIKMDSIMVRPDASSGRTCAAWADILHFSGCSGKIEIAHSYLSAANDDAINVHGTHLKVIKIAGPDKVQVKFMHPQTYGFRAFAPQDSIAFIQAESLLPVASNVVTAIQAINDRECMLMLKAPVSADIKIGDVVENITATPELWVHHNTITRIPTRGILATTRRKALIEHNRFENVHMSAVFVNDDASGWYESGMVKDMSIRHNHFSRCGEPVINIHPENTVSGKTAVHSNISVSGNTFSLQGAGLLSAKSTGGILISGNVIHCSAAIKHMDALLHFDHCTGVQVINNKLVR